MATLLEAVPVNPGVIKKTWTRTEVERLGIAGVLDPERYELIEGELIERVVKHLPHIVVRALLTRWLQAVFGSLSVVIESSLLIR
jgi:hypothetical protein